jgi:hypothetical protein
VCVGLVERVDSGRHRTLGEVDSVCSGDQKQNRASFGFENERLDYLGDVATHLAGGVRGRAGLLIESHGAHVDAETAPGLDHAVDLRIAAMLPCFAHGRKIEHEHPDARTAPEPEGGRCS